jgi:dihydroorotase
MGVSNENADDALAVNKQKNRYCGIKIFMGSSTGSMLVDNIITLEKIFAESEVLIATHCEKEFIVHQNKERLLREGVDINHARYHPVIRDVEACYESSLTAIQLAKKHDSRLHILHISTAKELELFTNLFPLVDKKITSEVCVHHLHFTADDYDRLGYQIKCNPAIKSRENKEALWEALLDNRIDVIATDHAPHTWEEKQGSYEHAHAGLPLVQHPLLLMLHYYKEGRISLERIAEKMSHAVADCFQISQRGYIREGYHADLVLVNLNEPHTVTKDNLLYHCGWSPLEGFTFPATITHTFVNGNLVYANGQLEASNKGQRLKFERN